MIYLCEDENLSLKQSFSLEENKKEVFHGKIRGELNKQKGRDGLALHPIPIPHKKGGGKKSSFCTHCDDGDDDVDACSLQRQYLH